MIIYTLEEYNNKVFIQKCGSWNILLDSMLHLKDQILTLCKKQLSSGCLTSCESTYSTGAVLLIYFSCRSLYCNMYYNRFDMFFYVLVWIFLCI